MPKYSAVSNKLDAFTTPDGIPIRCLYITNVPVSASQQHMMNVFSKFGTVKSLFIRTCGARKQKTSCFVTFETPEQAHKAFLNRRLLNVNNSKLYVAIADSWHQPIVGPNGEINYQPWKAGNCQQSVDNEEDVNTTNNEDEEEDEEEIKDEDVEEINTTENCPIAKLNEDCLLLIVEFIPFSSRHIMSRVCSRWRNLMKSYWSKFKELDFNSEPFDEVTFSESNLKLYLKLCPNITSVNLSRGAFDDYYSSENPPSSESIITIACLCKNLEELTLEGIEMVGRPMAVVAHTCKQLKSLTIKDCRFGRDNEMHSIMKKCLKLETLRVTYCTLNPGKWLTGFRTGLKSLSFISCQMNFPYFNQGLLNVKHSLQELELIIESSLSFSIPSFNFQFFKDFTKLESIAYRTTGSTCQKGSPDMFQNLKQLKLERNDFVSDTILKGIIKHSPNLNTLDLSKSKHPDLTMEGYKAISQLSNLVNLNLSLNEIEDEVLEALATNSKNLKLLSIEACHKITDTGCKRIVSNLMKLSQLKIAGCKGITNKTVSAAVEAAIQNPDKVKLVIHAIDTGIVEDVVPLHNKVEINMNERSKHLGNLCHYLFDDLDNDIDYDDDDDDDDYDDENDYDLIEDYANEFDDYEHYFGGMRIIDPLALAIAIVDEDLIDDIGGVRFLDPPPNPYF